MKSNTSKLVGIGLLVPVTGLALFMVYQLNQAVSEVPDRLLPEAPQHGAAHTEAGHGGGGHGDAGHGGGDAHGGGGHGEAKADAHGGGGHGEAKADAHGGGHGDAGGHGEAKADGHGGGDGHGAPPAAGAQRATASIGLFSVDEIYVNVGYGDNVKSLGVKLEIELFEENTRSLFEQNTSGIRHTVIEASRVQDAGRLTTVSGKLYFKEFLVTRLNSFFKKPVVREVHFSSFYLQ